MDVERVMQSRIPDIAVVYGGIRGRTMSSARQAHAWRILSGAGVRQIIDLRQDYQGDGYRMLCRSFGMDYFHYPVHNGKETIASMVEHFGTFCDKIEQGDFFISCAQGLHRTDIALCTYWVFCGADKGEKPPQLVGYLKEKGHDADKIFNVLNSFYRHYSELAGKPPLPLAIFKERKLMINHICNGDTYEWTSITIS